MQWYITGAVAAISLLLMGCEAANLNTVSRSTGFGSQGKAIHLDAKQRVVLTKDPTGFGEIVCAEPAPDALSAYSSSFGFGASAPSYGAASVAQALSEASGSIGLRTQSIQLMRDALYRVCEAYFGRALNQQMVMQLHERFQDIMVANLAIEQLTGAVVAKQVVLSGGAAAAASAQIATNQKQVDEAIADEKAKKDKAAASEKIAKEKEQAAETAGKALKAEQDKGDDADKDQLRDIEGKFEAAQQEANAAREQADLDAMEAKAATEFRELAQKARSVATQATANAITSGRFSTDTTGGIDAASVKDVADAVKAIALEVLQKDHVRDSCLVVLTSKESKDSVVKLTDEVRKFCADYLKSLPTREEQMEKLKKS